MFFVVDTFLAFAFWPMILIEYVSLEHLAHLVYDIQMCPDGPIFFSKMKTCIAHLLLNCPKIAGSPCHEFCGAACNTDKHCRMKGVCVELLPQRCCSSTIRHQKQARRRCTVWSTRLNGSFRDVWVTMHL